MGFIYLIVNNANDKWYVGQTTGTLHRRWIKHVSEAKRFARGQINPALRNKRGTCSKLYRAMNKYGVDVFRMEKVEELDDDSLDLAETELIAMFNTVADGYNLKEGGDSSRHSEETKKQISESMKSYKSTIVDKYRTHEEVKGLPKYCIFVKNSKFTAVAINNHPKCKRKSFSVGKYGSLENAKVALLEYLKQLETL